MDLSTYAKTEIMLLKMFVYKHIMLFMLRPTEFFDKKL
jgi:hypothetical protein